jgi:hypothetical protein
MLYSSVEVHNSIFGDVLAFIAEWPGAQVFMLLMGVSFPLSKTFSTRRVLLKAFALLFLGYLLNYLKLVLPIQLGVMPKEFLSQYGGGNLTKLDFFLTGDILQFAAIALLVLHLVRRFQFPALAASVLALLVMLLSPILWDLHSDNRFADHLLSLFFGGPPQSYFPVFPWLVYPLVGFAIGIGIKTKFHGIFQGLLIIGAFAFLIEFAFQFTRFHFPVVSFYRTYPDQTLMHLGFTVAWFGKWHFIAKKFTGAKVFTFLCFLSRNITLIYFIQWVLIFWCFPLFGYHRLDLSMSVLISVSICITVFQITYLTGRLFSSRSKQDLPQQVTSFFYES